MIFDNNISISEEYNFILVFGNDCINKELLSYLEENAFEFNNPKSKNTFSDINKINIGTIRIRDKRDSSAGMKNDAGLSIKVDFDKNLRDIPVVIDTKTGDIKNRSKDGLLVNKNNYKIKASKINYIQNFIYDNFDDIVAYYKNDDNPNIQKDAKNAILKRSINKSFKKGNND